MSFSAEIIVKMVKAYHDITFSTGLPINSIILSVSDIARSAEITRPTAYRYLRADIGWVQTEDGWGLSKEINWTELQKRASLPPKQFWEWWTTGELKVERNLKVPTNKPAPVGLKKEHAEIVKELTDYLAERKDVEVTVAMSEKARNSVHEVIDSAIINGDTTNLVSVLANVIIYALESE